MAYAKPLITIELDEYNDLLTRASKSKEDHEELIIARRLLQQTANSEGMLMMGLHQMKVKYGLEITLPNNPPAGIQERIKFKIVGK